MPSVADALRAFAPDYLLRYGDAVPAGHRRVLNLLTKCGTGELGGIVYECDSCGEHHWMDRSCGNRHCPSCQQQKTQQWLVKQSQNLLPVHYFLVTFTVPQELRLALRGQQWDGYSALFDAAAEALRDVMMATRSTKDCEPGFFGVLHTWGRDPTSYHPHIHFVVPGGAVKTDVDGNAQQWRPASEMFLVHHPTLIRTFKAKFKDKLAACSITDDVPRRELAKAWKKKSVVDIEAVGNGEGVLKYLAPYVYRVAISNNRIVAVDDTHVTFRMTPSGTKSTITKRVTGNEFVRGFCQHILPQNPTSRGGFHKIRYYGFMTANSRIKREEVRWLASFALGLFFTLRYGLAVRGEQTCRPAMKCSECGGNLRLWIVVDGSGNVLVDHRQRFLDSG